MMGIKYVVLVLGLVLLYSSFFHRIPLSLLWNVKRRRRRSFCLRFRGLQNDEPVLGEEGDEQVD